MDRYRFAARTAGVLGAAALVAPSIVTGCYATPDRVESTDTVAQPSVTTPQVPLDGSTIPQFVDALPTLSGTRVNGKGFIDVNMVEFRQRVLPDAFYPTLAAPFAAGTLLWGYDINNLGPSWPGQTIESRRGFPTIAFYFNNLRGPGKSPPQLQQYLTQDLTLHWADPIGVSRKNHCVVGDEVGGEGADREVGGEQDDLPAACLVPYAGPVPVVPHLHGAEVLSAFDGHPDAWFTPGLAQRGRAFISNVYHYPNQQEAGTLWLHDHSLGTTRLNVYAGLASFYLLRDNRDTGRPNNPITLPAGALEQELLIADRQFDTNGNILFPDGSPANDPTGFNGAPPNPNLHPFALPEFFGDVMTVNGKSWPYFRVQPRRYRFRVLNGSNARFLQMQLSREDRTNGQFNGIATRFTDPNGAGIPGPPIWQIGADGALLNAPVNVDLIDPGIPEQGDPRSPHLVVAPAERSDIIIDFSGQFGRRFILTNDAPAPFPGGGVTVEPLPPPALQGPTLADPDAPGPYEVIQQVMEFRVDLPFAGVDTSFNPASSHPPLRAAPVVNIKTGPFDVRRQLVLDEVEGPGGPDEVLLNNTHWNGRREGSDIVVPGSVSNGRGIKATEVPQVGATELWEIANLTPDAHPIHLHLIQFQVIETQPFNTELDLCGLPGPQYRVAWDALFPGGTFNGFSFPPGTFIPGFGPPSDYLIPNADGAIGGNLAFSADNNQFFVGPPVPPAPRDRGWKDTFRMFPCAVTRVAVRFAPQDIPAGATHPGTNEFPFDPSTGGPGYVWHCHILDHEDNEMMRPMLISK